MQKFQVLLSEIRGQWKSMEFLPAAWGPVAGRPCVAGGCAHQQHICTGAWRALERQRLKHRLGAGRGPGWLRWGKWKRHLIKAASTDWHAVTEEQNTADSVFWKPKYLRIRWDAIMRGTWVLVVAVGRMVLKVWGLGADGRIALGMFWKSEGRGNNIRDQHWTTVQFFQC